MNIDIAEQFNILKLAVAFSLAAGVIWALIASAIHMPKSAEVALFLVLAAMAVWGATGTYEGWLAVPW